MADEPISPIGPRWSSRIAASQMARSSAWSWVITSTWVPGGSSASTSSGSTGTGCTCTAATASASGARASSSRWSARESTRCRSRSWRARMRASSRPTWPTPKTATDGHHGERLEQHGDLAAAALHAVLSTGALSERWDSKRLGRGRAVGQQRPRAAYGLGLEVAAADRAPGLPGGDDHLGAGLTRGVPADVGERDEYAGPRGRAAARPRPATRSSSTAASRSTADSTDPVERPVDLLGRRGRGQLDAGAGAARTRPHACAQRLADGEGQHQRRFADGLGAVDRAVLVGVVEQRDAESRSASPRSWAACRSSPPGSSAGRGARRRCSSQRRSSSVSQPAPCTKPPSICPRSTSGERLSPTSWTMSTRRGA